MRRANNHKILAEACTSALKAIGEDPSREGLLRTPDRYARAMLDMTSGYDADLNELINEAIFVQESSEMIVVRSIEFYSMCEHHLLPFFGHAHVAYIPNGKMIGLSKIPRIVHAFARRLQVQERLTEQVVDALYEVLSPVGAGCVIEARHLCMMMRGVQVQSSSMVTSALRGEFLQHATREEFMRLARIRGE